MTWRSKYEELFKKSWKLHQDYGTFDKDLSDDDKLDIQDEVEELDLRIAELSARATFLREAIKDE